MGNCGIGDLINTMLTASIAVLLILLIEERVGSMALIVFPTVVGGLAATIGVFTLPYVRLITTELVTWLIALLNYNQCL